jgi:hypothetical protein
MMLIQHIMLLHFHEIFQTKLMDYIEENIEIV